jgi:hypothetical protein
MNEKQIGDRILAEHPNMFRNAVGYGIAGSPKHVISKGDGIYLVKKGTPVRFGLMTGSGDYIGWEPVIITADMVGKTVAVFQSIEVKTLRDRLSEDQRRWNRAVARDGGIVQVWHETIHGIEILEGEKIL